MVVRSDIVAPSTCHRDRTSTDDPPSVGDYFRLLLHGSGAANERSARRRIIVWSLKRTKCGVLSPSIALRRFHEFSSS